jgi:hypothetical protein
MVRVEVSNHQSKNIVLQINTASHSFPFWALMSLGINHELNNMFL